MSIDPEILGPIIAEAIIGLAATDAWTAMRARLSRIFGKDKAILNSVDQPETARQQLRAMLERRPELIAELAELLRQAGVGLGPVTQIATASHSGVVIQAGRDAYTADRSNPSS